MQSNTLKSFTDMGENTRLLLSLHGELGTVEDRLKSGKPPVFSVATLLLFVFDPNELQNPMELFCQWYQSLLRISNHTNRYYHSHLIPKRSGGFRTLMIPYYEVDQWQRVILEQVLPLYPISPYAKAYRKGVSIADNARPHKGKAFVVKIDLKNFFDSITYSRVYGVLMQNPDYNKAFVTMVTNLCCVNGHLPQGACTSPMLSNICFYRVDQAISEYCDRKGLTYTRYCDDLTISGDAGEPYRIVYELCRLLRAFGYTPNEDKISVRHKGQRMAVTGITVNETLRTSREYRKKIRQEIYYIEKFGLREHILRGADPKFVYHGRCRRKQYLRPLYGRIRYALAIDPADAEMERYSRLVEKWLK